MPDLKSKDVAAAALKIQSVYRGFQTRKVAKTALSSTTQKLKEVLKTNEFSVFLRINLTILSKSAKFGGVHNSTVLK